MTKLIALLVGIGLFQVAAPETVCPTPEQAFLAIQKIIDEYRAGLMTDEEFAKGILSVDPQDCRALQVPDCGKDCSHVVEQK